MPETRLATYGTLAPGRVNAHVLAELTGPWSQGTVRGRLIEAGWGADMGYPGMIADPDGDEIEVFVFESEDLPDHWQRLDEFEGDGYERIAIVVTTPEGVIDAYIYQVKQ